MAAAAGGAGGGCGGSGAASVEGEVFSEVEKEVAAILLDLPSLVRSRRRRRRRERPEIPTWGCRRPRTVAGAEKPAVAADRGEGAASPDTPLAFPEESGGDDDDAAAAKKARTQAEEQRGAVANLAQEKAHLIKQIEDYRARLQSSRSTNDDLKQMQTKLQVKQEEEEDELSLRLQVATPPPAQAHATDRPAALVLDLNEPARAPEEDDVELAKAKAVAEWCRRGQQQRAMMVHRAALTADARRRRREIRRAKGAAPIRKRKVGSS